MRWDLRACGALVVGLLLVAGCASGREEVTDEVRQPDSVSDVWTTDTPDSVATAGKCTSECPLLRLYAPEIDMLTDPFANVEFLKVCYREPPQTKLFDCRVQEFTGPEVTELPALPLDTEIQLVAEGYTADAFGDSPMPDTLFSRGTSVPFKLTPGEESGTVVIYMAAAASFVPTVPPPAEGLYATTPSAPAGARLGAAGVRLFDDSVLLVGGIEALAAGCEDPLCAECVAGVNGSAELYRPTTGAFESLDVGLNTPRAQAAAVNLPDGRTAILGGLDGNGEPLDSVELYDPIGMTFTVAPALMETRAYHTATLLVPAESYVLLVGGYGSGPQTWEVWHPDHGSVAAGELHEPRWNHTATLLRQQEDPALPGNSVAIIGGESGTAQDEGGVRKTVEFFDIDAQSMSPTVPALCSNGGATSPNSVGRTLHTATFVPDRHFIYVVGGFDDVTHANPRKDICVWHTTQQKWAGEAGNFMLPQPLGGHTATPLADNGVLFAGGLTLTNGTLCSAPNVNVIFEYLTENGETVVDIGPGPDFPISMVTPRWGHGALFGADGKVFLWGGLTGCSGTFSPATSSELFQPM